MTSTHGAWRHAEARFLLSGVSFLRALGAVAFPTCALFPRTRGPRTADGEKSEAPRGGFAPLERNSDTPDARWAPPEDPWGAIISIQSKTASKILKI